MVRGGSHREYKRKKRENRFEDLRLEKQVWNEKGGDEVRGKQ